MSAIQDNSRLNKQNNVQAAALATVMAVGAVAVYFLAWAGMLAVNIPLSPDPVRDGKIAAEEARQAEIERLASLGPVKSMLDIQSVARGKRLFQDACISCHGPEGRGVVAMGGKDLVTSYFARKRTDKELADFIIQGRTMDDPRNTSKRIMPPRGGRVDYTDQSIADVVSYLRYLADTRRVAGTIPEVKVDVLDAPAPVVAVASPAPTVTVDGATTQPTGVALASAFDPEQLARGKRTFNSCIACHAKTGLGVPRTGADLVHSTFVKTKTDEELTEFVKKGRSPSDPESTLKLQMPPKGGNPSLKDEQLKDVIVYIRSLQQAAAEAK